MIRAAAQRMFRIKGLCSAPVTPMKPNGDVNIPVIKDYVKFYLDHNVPTAFVTGTTGEGNNMTLEERKAVAEEWVKQGKGKLDAVIVHIGAGNLRDSQALAKHAEQCGADAIACVGPTYHKPDTMDMYIEYMAAVAAAAPSLPFFLYDIDFYTGITYEVSTFFTLAKPKIPTLCGVKHTSPNVISINNTTREHPDIQLLLGSDDTYLQGLSIGVDWTIMNAYNGHVLTRLREKFLKGDMEGARKEQERMLKVRQARAKNGFGVPDGSKAIMNLLGLPVGQARIPCRQASPETLEALRKDLEEIGFFNWTKKDAKEE